MNRALIAFAAIAMMVGCAKDEAAESLASDCVAKFSTESAMSRVSTSGSSSTWEVEDLIGISSSVSSSAYDVNVEYKVTSNENSTISFGAVGDQIVLPRNAEVTYTAYYPYQNAEKYTSNVTDQSDLGEIDLLVSDSVTAKEDGNTDVKFTFSHALSMVQFEISLQEDLKKEYTDWATNLKAYLTSLTLGDAVQKATYSFVGDYVATTATGSISVPVAKVSGATYDALATAIINPTKADVTMSLSMLFGSYYYETSFTLAAYGDNIYKYEVVLGCNSITVSRNPSITPWAAENSDNYTGDLGMATEN